MSAPNEASAYTGLEVAIVGMAGRFPGAQTVDQLWANLCAGMETITFFSDDELEQAGVGPALLDDPNYVKASGVLKDVDRFDAAFFGYTPREASRMDPQQRLFLECAWAALEHAGYAPTQYQGAIGVYAGVGFNGYLHTNLAFGHTSASAADEYQATIGNDKDFLATRVAYKLNLTGPSLTVQTACSSSLVATHLACQSLISGESDIALAGGVAIRIPQTTGYMSYEGGIIAPDGHCRAFDARAQGTVVSSGVGVVVLKRLEDALADGDTIYAVIKGSAINNDGGTKAGYAAPSVEGQARVIQAAQRVAGVSPETITYIETHGTGTRLGDPIEIAALTRAFRASTQRTQFCAIGSVKTNLGHLDTAAGVTGLIKAALALKHRRIPPSLHFETPNPQIDFARSPFYVADRLLDWPAGDTPRRAGVSSFGIGGTNAHIILEEAPAPAPSGPARDWQLLVLSAKTPSALEAATSDLATYLHTHPDTPFADVVYTRQVGRAALGYRRALVCQDRADALTALETPSPQRVLTAVTKAEDPPVYFLFPGQGAQYVQMAAGLYHGEPFFRETLDKCAELLSPYLGLDLRSILYPTGDVNHEGHEGIGDRGSGIGDRAGAESTRHSNAQRAPDTQNLDQTQYTQPALFTIEYALAQLLMRWGVQPQALIGHSIGEYVAACLAGVFSLEDGLRLVAARGQLMQGLPGGGMLAVPLPESDVRELLGPQLDLAVINGPAQSIVAGPHQAIMDLEHVLLARGVEARRLHTSHAFHSAMMDPILDAFTAQVCQVALHPPSLPYLSNVTGTSITAAQATDPGYWATHLRDTVRFHAGLDLLLANQPAVLVEVGPGRSLSTLARQHPARASAHTVLTTMRHPREQRADTAALLEALGQLWLAGITPNWQSFYAGQCRQRIPLPTYPFERQRYWVEPVANHGRERAVGQVSLDEPVRTQVRSRPQDLPANPVEQMLLGIWRELLGVPSIGIHDNFFDLGGDSLLAIQIIARINQTLQVKLTSHSLLEAPTIAALASRCTSTNTTPAAMPSTLVELQAGRGRRPLFMVHPVGGSVYVYRDLVRELGSDQPFYGLQAHDDPTLASVSIPDLARRYLVAVRAVQPEGPYLLGGFSFGGVVAFEMAQQLHQAGQSVSLLTLIDAPWPAHLTGEEAIPEGTDLPALQSVLGQVEERLQALRSYTPATYPGQIVYFSACERDPRTPTPPELEWVRLATTDIAIHHIPGNHRTMNEPPNVQVMAGWLRSHLDHAEH